MKRSAPTKTPTEPQAERRSVAALWGGMFLGGAIAMALLLGQSCETPAEETVTPVEFEPSEPERPQVELLRARVVERYPHDVTAFTQGLLWADGALYESTGQYGGSTLRRVRLRDGKVLAERELSPQFFGEGLARVGQRLIQLTWREEVAIVSNLDDLGEERTLQYSGEGWGLCHDGEALVMSNGSATLTFRDPDSMAIRGRVTVRRDGVPVSQLNELECVDGTVYANVWRRQEILRIDPSTGEVTGVIDARGLLSSREAFAADVLNGIAYRTDTGTFLLTGKYWPALFEVEFVPR
ncbi:MAG: glutaminyl-peptide cyclotransferase [Myxococcota bacterium]